MAHPNKYKAMELKIREALEQMRNGKGGMFDVATWCVALSNESDSYADAIGIKTDDVIDHLNGFLRDFAVDLAEMATLLKFFPKREQWNRPLLDLLAEAHQHIKDQKPDSNQPRQRKAVKLAEYEELKAKLADAQAELRQARAHAADMQTRVRELEHEKARLEGRIEELERIVSRSSVKA